MSATGYAKAGRRHRLGDYLRDLAAYIIVLVFFLPALWIIITSVRPNVEINTRPPVWIPSEITLDSYKILLGWPTPEGAFGMGGNVPFGDYARNSIVIATVSTAVALAFGTLAGFAFARFTFKAKNGIFLGMMLARAVPGIALSLPLFVLFAALGRQHQDGRLPVRFQLAQLPANFETVHFGHNDVEDHRLEPLALGFSQGFSAVGRQRHAKTQGGEQFPNR